MASSKNRTVFALLAVVLLLGGIGGLWYRSLGQESTDDAQVDADVVPLAVRTSGLVLEVLVKEDQQVEANDIIMVLDPNEQAARVAQAEAQLATERARQASAEAQVAVVDASSKGGLASAEAAVAGFSVGVQASQAQVAAAKATVERAKADAHKAELDLQRAKTLRAANAIPAERQEAAQAEFDSSHAALDQAEAQLDAAQVNRDVAGKRVTEARGRLGQSTPIAAQMAAARAAVDLARASVQAAEASLRLSRLQFDYLKVRAPVAGIISRMHAHEGQLLAMGQAVGELVPNDMYVVANFKETQVGTMRPGQPAEVVLDAYPGRPLHGKVISLAGGTGSRFALLPPDNASGNFVKVVQRVPVRIAIDLEEDETLALRAGLSAEVSVRVDR
jgi:membrane fusion protein (multidrug efflux system)